MQVRASTRATARLRGAAVGAISATLAVAAHATGGAMLPGPSALLLLVVLGTALGGVATLAPTRRSALLALLGVGQLVGHLVLSLSTPGLPEMSTSDMHATDMHSTTTPMLVAHTLAVVVAAVLVELAQRTLGTCAGALARVWPRLPRPLVVRPQGTVRPATPARQAHRTALLAVALPRRGPPVRA